MEFHAEVFDPFVELGIAREGNTGLIIGHDVGDRGPIQLCFGQEGAEPLQMQNGIVLSDAFGIPRRRGYFPLSLGRPGNRRTRKLEYVAGRRVSSISDDGPNKVGIRVPNQLTTAVSDAVVLCGFDIAKQSL